MKIASGGKSNAGLSLAFGAFTGLTLWKLGNPVILEYLVTPPDNVWAVWPLSWGYAMLAILCLGTIWMGRWGEIKSIPKWLLALPLAWLAWQFLSSTHSVDPKLSKVTLPHFCACVSCFYLGFFVASHRLNWKWFGAPLLLCFLLSLWMAFEQHYGGLEETRKQFLSQPGVELYPKWYLLKLQSNRVFGSFVYPNALAGAILLLLPVSLRLTWLLSYRLADVTRLVLVGVVSYAELACLYWSESKGGWIIALGVGLFALSQLAVSKKIKVVVLLAVLLGGTAGFLIKFEAYLKKGATSVGARFGYWQAALDTTKQHPILGSGPGTFSVAYAKIKPPEAEMARLAHNDYLEQASDSGIPGCIIYLGMIGGWLLYIYRRTPLNFDSIPALILLGLTGWCAQAFIEFQLYIPGLAWPVFLLFGILLATAGDKTPLPPSKKRL